MSKILDAVSIVLVHGDEVFAIQRQNFLKSFPGYWAFPGGKVDAGDETIAKYDGVDDRLWGAVIREAREEIGLDLTQTQIERVDFLGIAVTPDFNPYRFATHFFKIHLKNKPKLTIDHGEAFIADWFKPTVLVSMYERGEMLVVPPVLKVYRALAHNIQTGKVEHLDVRYDALKEVPSIESICGVKQFMPLSHTLPPASRTNCFLVGDEKKFIIDPSPMNEEEKEKLLYSLREHRLTGIMLTHHHGDHHQFAPQIAQHLNVPIYLSADTQMRIERHDSHYFKGLELRHLQEGDVLTSWLGHALKIIAVPGHDEGQLALMPENRAWFLAGDLFQGIGTVVIGGEEGDMAKYMQTLEKVIALKPRAVYPSHGIALGGTYILEKTLDHRRMREEQVLSLKLQHKTDDEILDVLYADIPQALRKYAMKNIHAHLHKLKLEKKIN